MTVIGSIDDLEHVTGQTAVQTLCNAFEGFGMVTTEAEKLRSREGQSPVLIAREWI